MAALGATNEQALPAADYGEAATRNLFSDVLLERLTGQRPIIFYTNGYETWLWDDPNYAPRPVQDFSKQDELQLLIHRNLTSGMSNYPNWKLSLHNA
jgi:type I site-specific restriction endonuclease